MNAKRLLTASDRRNQENPIAFLERAGFAAEEADIFLVEIDIEKLADLALLIADMARQTGKTRGEIVQGFGDRGGATVHFGRAVGEATKRWWNFDGHSHFCSPY